MGLRARVRRLPAIAWRDDRIAELRRSEKTLRAQVSRAERRLEQATTRLATVKQEWDDAQRAIADRKYSPTEPSWHTRIMEQARVGRFLSTLDTQREYPRRRLLEKLHNYELARSYGVATPRVIGSWPRITELPWDELPESFVIKSNRGYSGNGVLPLRRHGDAFCFLDSGKAITPEEIVRHYQDARGLAAPYFVEEVLPGTGAVLPDDVKIYAFYGEVADVMLRRVTRHNDISSFTYRFLDAEGNDRGRVQERHRHAPDIAVPRDLAHMVEAARVLSTAVPVPFVRVDLYQLPEGIMLGELTPLPGTSGSFTREHDRLLGRMYDEAEARVNLDFARGRPFAVVPGPHDPSVTTPMPARRSLQR
ncbi:ATP-grasp fold amidoligase family protein [Ornithinimicrobium murale]|uniref:ATP-grasp fold amidoligase family protein n=1 Tax=Ornithinimicrobium murale TaxID=1050153 RepID=UPI000E0CD0C3|nr:ATP-grasp fold amidoligase family protein [Ornithinimicrobium murale]